MGFGNHRFDKWLTDYDGIIYHKYVFDYMGYNLKPLDLQGAIGLVQIDKLDTIILRRISSKIRISEIFRKYLEDRFLFQAVEKTYDELVPEIKKRNFEIALPMSYCDHAPP